MQLHRRHFGIGPSLALGALLALASCEEVSVNVIDAASVEISPETVTVFEGREKEVTAIVKSAAGDVLTGRSVEWTIDDPEVATVSGAGVVRGEKTGTTTVRVRAEELEADALVTVLPPPEIGLSRSDVDLSAFAGEADPPDEEVEVVNLGGGTLSDLSISVETEDDEPGWLSASLASSVAPTTLTISASIANRPVGVYEGTVLVSSPESINSPQQVQVTLQVKEPLPVIRVRPSSILFNSVENSREPLDQTVDVTNEGGGILEELAVRVIYVDGSEPPWLVATLADTTAPTTLTLTASARRLSAGTYRAEVEVSDGLIPEDSETIFIEFQVSPGRDSSR
jgi:hypothetical protein